MRELLAGAKWYRYATVCLLLLLSAGGCAMCSSSMDCYYAAYGGRRARGDMLHGRVGSIFDPAQEAHDGGGLPGNLEETSDGTWAETWEGSSPESLDASLPDDAMIGSEVMDEGPALSSPWTTEPTFGDHGLSDN